ncbi:MAG: hemolysin family protein [Sporichthyaceae bacterium]
MIELALLILAAGLVAACGMFVAAEFSLVTVDRAAVERAAGAGDRAAEGTLSALRSLSTQLSGAQVGITVTNLAIGFLAEPSLARLLDGPLESGGVPPDAVPGIALGLGLTIATAVTMVAGELVPKNLALARPMQTARSTQLFQRGFTRAMGPVISALNAAANAILRRIGVEPQEELHSARSHAEIYSLVRRSAQEGVLEPRTADLLQRSLEFGGRTAEDVRTHRTQVQFVNADDPVEAVIGLARRTGLSRFPVVEADPDEVVGLVHVKQAVVVRAADRGNVRVREVASPALLVPAALDLDALSVRLRRHAMQMAVVVDEYGGVDGVVTLEDLVEELVGEIADEHDTADLPVLPMAEGQWALSGALRLDEVESATGISLPRSEHYETLAGLVLRRLGRIPVVGEQVQVDDVALVVLGMTKRRIDGVELRREAPGE